MPGLHLAAHLGAAEAIRLLLERYDLDANVPSPSGRTPLMHAAAAGNLAAVLVLLDTDVVEVQATDTVLGATSLQYAVMLGHADVVRALLIPAALTSTRRCGWALH